MDPVALLAAGALSAAHVAGTANNYRRTANEADDQDQWDARIDHAFGSQRDHVFGRLSNFQRSLRSR